MGTLSWVSQTPVWEGEGRAGSSRPKNDQALRSVCGDGWPPALLSTSRIQAGNGDTIWMWRRRRGTTAASSTNTRRDLALEKERKRYSRQSRIRNWIPGVKLARVASHFHGGGLRAPILCGPCLPTGSWCQDPDDTSFYEDRVLHAPVFL